VLLETARLVRVIAGALGGRRLIAPRGLATRPTSDRVREALFMTLEPLAGLRVMDLYAGSGALGIEALSRGASHVDFVESNAAARAVLQRNLAALEIDSLASLWSYALPQGLRRLAERVRDADLVLVDPPYGETGREVLSVLGDLELKPDLRVTLEHHARDPVPERCGKLVRVRERRYGETRVSLFRCAGGEDRPGPEEISS
jgi:16S rRNA (guanine(966)-N(2))-methyltransferase RsmD